MLPNRRRALLPLLCTLTATYVAASEIPTEFARATDHVESTRSRAWGYSRTTESGDEVRVERYDPDASAPWTLVSVDGVPPSEHAQRAYKREAKRRLERNHPGDIDFGDMIEIETLELVEKSHRHAIYRFRPTPDEDGDEKVVRKLVGTLRIDRAANYIEWMQMENAEPFSPQIGIKIEAILMRMEFAPPDGTRPGFIVSVQNDVDAKIAGLKRIEQREDVRFHDFVPPADPASNPVATPPDR